jgi:hypothetical protein
MMMMMMMIIIIIIYSEGWEGEVSTSGSTGTRRTVHSFPAETSSSPSFSSSLHLHHQSTSSPFSATRIQQLRLLTRRTRIIKAELLAVSCKAIQVNRRRMQVFLRQLTTASTTQSRLSIPPIQRPAAASSSLLLFYFLNNR